MDVYFVRTNGNTVHAGARAEEIVPGEPPGHFDYRDKCLREGFARIGWPNTGDLRHSLTGRLARHGYSLHSISPRHRRYLEEWSEIRVGDLILIPAGAGKYAVHLGVVTKRDRESRAELPARTGDLAYYYFHDVPAGEFYECAHRVDVRWDCAAGTAVVHHFPEIGGAWLSAFRRRSASAEDVKRAALTAGLIA